MECDKKEFQDRLHKIQGQIQAIEQMYLGKRTAEEILQQVVAVRASLGSLAKLIVEAEVKGCLAEHQEERPVSKLVETLFKVS